MGASRCALGLFRNALLGRGGGGGREWMGCNCRNLSSASDSQFSSLEMTGDRNVDIFDRVLKSKQVSLLWVPSLLLFC